MLIKYTPLASSSQENINITISSSCHALLNEAILQKSHHQTTHKAGWFGSINHCISFYPLIYLQDYPQVDVFDPLRWGSGERTEPLTL
jgi:hypothetical protein